jgi:hypothetical protein
MSTQSLMSYECLTKRNMQDPRNSWAVTEKIKDSEMSVEDAVERME